MSKAKKTYINIIIGILLFVGFRQIIAPSNGLTQTGVDLLASFLMINILVGNHWHYLDHSGCYSNSFSYRHYEAIPTP